MILRKLMRIFFQYEQQTPKKRKMFQRMHQSKRKSGFQQRKVQQDKMDVVKSMSASIFECITKTDDSQRSSKETSFHIDAKNDSDNISWFSGSKSEKTDSVMTNQEEDQTQILKRTVAILMMKLSQTLLTWMNQLKSWKICKINLYSFLIIFAYFKRLVL